MKTVYFVRHGESEANVQNWEYTDNESPLTVRGREQAEHIARRCAKLPFDVIISSTMARAQETAEVIAREHKVPMEASELFRERTMPTMLMTPDRYKEPLVTKRGEWFQSLYTENMRVADGENFTDIKVRAGQALKFLENRPENTILVVSHGFILRAILAGILFGDAVTPEILKKMVLHVRIENTGLSMLNYDPDATKTHDDIPLLGWSVHVWNDHAHLG